MEEFEFTGEEPEECCGGYVPDEDPNEDMVKPTDDYIPLDDEQPVPVSLDDNEFGKNSLSVTDDELNELGNKPVINSDETTEQKDDLQEQTLGRKVCPTRHGCSGATDCDYCGGDYPY